MEATPEPVASDTVATPVGSQVDIVAPHADLRDEDRVFLERLQARIERDGRSLVLPPAAAIDVMGLVDDPRTPVPRIAAAIANDPALAGAVLRLANSALHRGSAVVENLQTAVVRLGQRPLRMLLLEIVLGNTRVKGRPYEALAAMTWKHSLATARLARELAESCALSSDHAYLAGLFHNVGVLATLSAARRTAKAEGLRPNPAVVVEALHRHAYPLNPSVIERWNLPDEVATAIAHYRTWPADDGEMRLAALLQLVNDLMKHHGLWVAQRPFDATSQLALERLDLQPAQLPDRESLVKIAARVDAAARLVAASPL